MVWGAIASLAVCSCPPCAPVVMVRGPEMCCFPGTPAPVVCCEIPYTIQTIPSQATALVPVPCEPTTVTNAVVQDQAKEQPLEAVSTEDDESALEDAAFSMPGGFGPRPTLDHLGLGWGVASIGNGVLSPTPGISGGSGFGGFGGFGGGTSGGTGSTSGSNTGSSSYSGGGTTIITNILPPIVINIPSTPPIIINPPNKPPGQNPVPEPASVALWGAVAGLAWLRKRMIG